MSEDSILDIVKHLKSIRTMLAIIDGLIFFIGGFVIGSGFFSLDVLGVVAGIAVIAIGGLVAAIGRKVHQILSIKSK